MFILSQAIIPVFVFAVLVNFYHFNSILSMEVGENFTDCQGCVNSTCHTQNSGPCTVLPDNTTAQCFTCSEENGNKQYYSEKDCKGNCTDVSKCICSGKCYMCVEDNSTDTSSFTCDIPLYQWSDDCSTMVPYPPSVAPAA